MDYATRKSRIRNFAVDYPIRIELKTSDVLRGHNTVFFTNGSKKVCEARAGVSSDTHNVAES